MDLGQLWVTIGVNTAGLNVASASMASFAASSKIAMDKMSVEMDRASIRLQRFGSMATMYLTLPLVGAAVAAVKYSSDVEMAAQKTVALAGVAQSQMNAWQGSITRIGNATNVAAKDIGEAMYYTASAGVATAEVMNIVEMAAKGTAAQLGDTATIARFLTYAYNAYGKAALSSAKVMDILSVAVREGTAEASTMVGVLGNILPVAAAMGVPIDQVAAALAAMTRTGFDAAKSATALRQIMVSLLHPSQEAIKTLAGMAAVTGDASYSVAGLRKTLRDEGLMQTLIKVDELTKIFGETAAGLVFPNVRALTGDLSLVGANLVEVNKVFLATKTEMGVFANAFSILTQTMSFRLGTVKKALEQAFLGLGDSLIAPLTEALQKLVVRIKNLTEWYTSLSASSQAVIFSIAKFLVILGPIALGLSLVIRMFSFFRTTILLLIPVLKEAWVVMATNPMMQALAVFALLATAVYAYTNSLYELTEAQKALNKVNGEAEASLVKEKIQLEQLMRIAGSEYATKQQKAEAIKTINQISPEYLGSITKEEIRTGKATIAIQKYMGALREKARVQALTSAMEEEEKNYIVAVANGQNKQLSFWQKIAVQISKLNYEYDNASKLETENAEKFQKDHNDKITGYQNELDALNGIVAAKQKEQRFDATQAVHIAALSVTRTTLEDIEKSIKNIMSYQGTTPYVIPGMDTKDMKEREAAQAAKNKLEEEGAKNMAALNAQMDRTKSIGDIWTKYNESLTELNRKTELYGNTIDSTGKKFDAFGEASKLNESTLESLLKYYNASDPALKTLVANLGKYRGENALVTTTNQTLIDSIATANAAYQQTGDKVQWVSTKLESYKTALASLASGGISSGAAVDEFKNNILGLSISLSGDNLRKSLADAAVQSALLGGSFDSTGASTTAYKTQIDGLVALYKMAQQNGDEYTMSLLRSVIKTDQAEVSTNNLTAAMKAYNDAVQLTNTSNITYGRSFDLTSAQLKDAKDLVSTLNAQVATLTSNNQDATATQEQLNNAMNTVHLLEITKATEEYSKAVQDNTTKSLTAGRSYSLGKENLKDYITYLKATRDQMGVTSVEYAKQSDLIMDAEAKAAKANKQKEKISTALSRVQSEAVDFINAYSSMIDAQTTKRLAMIETVGKATGKSDAWIAKQQETIEKEANRRKKQAALATVAINVAMGISKIWAEAGINIPLAIISTALLVATGAMQTAAINAQYMAEGGVVPAGYANDTYPAMLSSGETVVPPNKLNLIDNGNNSSSKEKEFKLLKVNIKGRDLEYIYKEQYKLNNSY